MGRREARQRLLEILPKNGTGAEIGVFQGHFTPEILRICNPKCLYLVDPWQFAPQRSMPTFGAPLSNHPVIQQRGGAQAFLDRECDAVSRRYESMDHVHVKRQTSDEFFEECIDSKIELDWVYIDGDHSYEGVQSDLHRAWKSLKEGGVIAGDDLGLKNREGPTPAQPVKTALNDFLARHESAAQTWRTFGGQWSFRKISGSSDDAGNSAS